MTPRAIRRAAERKANKLVRKTFSGIESNSNQAAAIREEEQEPDDARTAANRANAQLSTGPRTFEGKAKVSLNALKNALTGRTILLPTDDAVAYESYLRAFADDFRPVGARETELVQSIAATAWRLQRVLGLEMAIFSQGSVEFATTFEQHDPSLRPGMIEFQTFLSYEKQLRNLHTQEARLYRRREKDLAELAKLQQDRQAQEALMAQKALDSAARRYVAAKHNNQPFDGTADGFEFSVAEIEGYLTRVSPVWMDRALAASKPLVKAA